jgi:aromatic amino acid aminotransferase I
MKPTAQFLEELTPSFLSMDTEGRVIRLDSFSKTVFPGLRLGYFIANPIFIERLLRATEVETQDPAGLSQAFVTGLLDRWGVEGYFNWLQHLKTQYERRRNWLLEAFHSNFVVLPAAESPMPSAQGLVVCLPEQGDEQGLRPVFSFVDPSAGMFVWSKFYLGGVQRFKELQGQADVQDPEQTFAHELWMEMVGESVLLTPGSYYHPWQGEEKVSTRDRGAEPEVTTFRFSFATPTVSLTDESCHFLWPGLLADTKAAESNTRRDKPALQSVSETLGLMVLQYRSRCLSSMYSDSALFFVRLSSWLLSYHSTSHLDII